MKRNAALLLLLALAAISCSSASDDEPPAPGPMRGPRRQGTSPRAARAGGGLLELLPPDQWWRDPQIAATVDLTPEQFAALDKLRASRGDDAAKLERDSMMALRDLRTVLGTEQPSSEDITSAANRMKALGDALFDRQVQYLATQRTTLSKQQWTALQGALENESQERMERRDPRSMGPRGRGRGGRGRFPG